MNDADERPDDRPVPNDDREPHSDEDSGRPTGAPDADGLRPGQPQAAAPTEAPEERGATPTTEHGPGGDL